MEFMRSPENQEGSALPRENPIAEAGASVAGSRGCERQYDGPEQGERKAAAMPPVIEEPLVSEDEIVRLVDAFYAKVRRDPILAPVFERAIAADAWPKHLAKMYDFWSGVMRTSGRYKGNPLAVHAQVMGLEEGMFEPWLALFRETACELFSPEVAAAFREKSERIAESLKLGLFLRLQQPPSARNVV
jgi:hemoglobin